MFGVQLCLLAVLALAAIASAGDVVVLTPETFDAQVSKGNWLVEFYAPWCGHCKRLAPVWEEVATEAANENADFKVANIDCDANKEVCAKFGVRGYPTLKFFHGGNTVYNYPATQERSKANLLQFAKSGYAKEAGQPAPFANSKAGGAKGKKAEGIFAEIEEALPSTFQSAIEWMRRNVEIACMLSGSIATIVGYVLGRLTAPSWTPNPPVVVAAPSPSPVAVAAKSPSKSESTAGLQQRKVAKK